LTTPNAGKSSVVPELLGGRYRLEAPIAAGGMSTVHRGWDVVHQRAVAVKLYLPNEDTAARRRFDEEVRTQRSLSHPGLVPVYDAGCDDGQPYLILGLVEGETLRDRLSAGPLPAGQVRRLGARLAEILAYVHSQGVIHRDVKPSNVLLDADTTPYLSDFGISRMVDGTRLTATGQFVGTAGYLAPEQVLGEEVGPAADVYALGLVLLECLTGQAEYTGSDVEMAVARLNREPRIPGDIPLDLASAIGAMTARDPRQRPAAVECSAFLYNALAAPAHPASTVTGARWGRALLASHRHGPAARPRRQRQARLAVATAAVITLLAGGLGLDALSGDGRPVRSVTVDSAPPASLVATVSPGRPSPLPRQEAEAPQSPAAVPAADPRPVPKASPAPAGKQAKGDKGKGKSSGDEGGDGDQGGDGD
jgi:eukaryotic-like serine/threonine-protein kinase